MPERSGQCDHSRSAEPPPRSTQRVLIGIAAPAGDDVP